MSENYSFTFTIPAFKKVYYKSRYRVYSKMNQLEQYHFLEKQLHRYNIFKMIKWVYEEHEDKRLHVHGYILNTQLNRVEEFRNNFYTFPINIQRKSYDMFSLIKFIFDERGWVDYCNKHQREIIYRMGVDQDIKNGCNLDSKEYYLKIEEREDISPQYFNSIERGSIDDSDMGPSGYLFGKLNKFTIEI